MAQVPGDRRRHRPREQATARKLIEVSPIARSCSRPASIAPRVGAAQHLRLGANRCHCGCRVSRFEGETDKLASPSHPAGAGGHAHGRTVRSYRFLALQASFPDLKDVGVVARGRVIDVVLLGNEGRGTVTSQSSEKVRSSFWPGTGRRRPMWSRS